MQNNSRKGFYSGREMLIRIPNIENECQLLAREVCLITFIHRLLAGLGSEYCIKSTCKISYVTTYVEQMTTAGGARNVVPNNITGYFVL